MIDFTKVKFVVTNWFKNVFASPVLSSCTHEYLFLDQVWERTAKKRFTLRNRFGCTKCQGVSVKAIGE